MLKHRTFFFFALFIVVLFLGLLLIYSPTIKHAPHLDDLDSGGFSDAIYALALASLVLFLAAGLGRIIIKPFKLVEWTFIERTVISLPLGLAAIGYAEFFMGLLGWLKPIHHIALLIVVAIISFKNSVDFLIEGISAFKQFPVIWREFTFIKKFFFSVGALALMLAFFQTLTPPYDYDGLMYHLQGPRLFLDAGRIIPIPENWFTYYPATWEMVYMLGMGLGSDVFARLIHFTTLLLLLFSTFAIGRRVLNLSGAWLATAIMIGVPILLVWGTFAYTDIAWALFQFLATSMVLIWILQRNHKLLILAGLLQGLALGSKYFALSGLGILGLCIIWFSLHGVNLKQGLRKTLVNGAIFGISSLLVASPWLIKNMVWTGNPVFPFYFPQQVINPVELDLVVDYLYSFGTGKAWFDYLLLPFTIFTQFTRFATFMGNIEVPNPIFLLALAYPFTRKKEGIYNQLVVNTLAVITFGQFIFWALGSQQNRFLLPLFPGLSIITSSIVIFHLKDISKKFRLDWVIKNGAIGGMVIATLAIAIRLFFIIQPFGVILNLQTKTQFLSSTINDYDGIDFINNRMPENARVLLIWDGRGYYCNGKCYADVGPSVWTALIKVKTDNRSVASWLLEKDITHILLTRDDMRFYLKFPDHKMAAKFFLENFAPACSEEIYSDESVHLFELRLQDGYCY